MAGSKGLRMDAGNVVIKHTSSATAPPFPHCPLAEEAEVEEDGEAGEDGDVADGEAEEGLGMEPLGQ